MKIIQYKIVLIILFAICVLPVYSQATDTVWAVRYDTIVKRVRQLEKIIPRINQKVTNSVTGVPLNEFLRAIAISSEVNLSIDPKLNFQVINNFSDTKISDILLFLCDQYRFDISSIGSIIVIKSAERPIKPDKCEVLYDPQSKTLSLDVDNAELGILARKITDATGQNVIPANGLINQKIKTYVQKIPVSAALEKMAFSNNIVSKLTEDGIFLIEKLPAEKTEIQQPKAGVQTTASKTEKEGTYKLNVLLLGKDSLRIYSEKAPVSEVLKEISNKSGNDFIMSSVPKGEVTLQINGAGYQDILRAVLTGTDHVFKKHGKIHIIGNKNSPDLMDQVFVQLQYRTVDSVLNLIPKDLVSDIETKVFRELNSLMLSGPVDKVEETERFIRSIDRLVPVVSIEVMIIDFNSSFTVSTGITAGVTNEQVPPTSGKVFPGVEMNLNSQSINDLIKRFNGLGWAKIGKVTPNFYVQLKAMENQGILNIRSTPILSTLNGHQTRLSIGNTEYYLEEQFNIIGTQNPQSTKIQTYKPVDAELEVIITPVVSGDDQITLEVEVNQSDFTARISTNAPPGKVSRTFKSQIRVRNEEMILLGGLEESKTNQTSSGTPFLSRIPILKWLFSIKNEEKSKSKLNIFIKPTIIS